MDRGIYCGTHCDTLQLLQWAIVYALFYFCFCVYLLFVFAGRVARMSIDERKIMLTNEILRVVYNFIYL